MLLLRALCFGVLTLVSAAGVAQAPTTSAPAPAVDAREAFRRGEAAYNAGNYDAAIRDWKSAYAADPRPRIQFNLSQAYERIGEPEKAMASLRQFLDSANPDDPMYSDANARLSALRERIAGTGLIVSGGAEGGSIIVDQKDWGRTPRPDKITLAPGSHQLLVTWPGRPEFRSDFIVPAGKVIEVALPADAGGKPAIVASPEAAANGAAAVDTRDYGKKQKIMLIALGGTVAAIGAGLLVYGGVRGGDKVDCDAKYCPDPSQNDAVKTQSTVGYAIGGVLLAGGAGLLVWGVLSGKDDTQATARCGLGLASASCRFRF